LFPPSFFLPPVVKYLDEGLKVRWMLGGLANPLTYRIADVARVTLSGDSLDHPSEHAIAEVGIGIVPAGWLIQRPVVQGPFDQLRLAHLEVHEHRIGSVIGPAAAGMGEQMLDRDLIDPWMIRRGTVVGAGDCTRTEDSVGQSDAACLNERTVSADGLGCAGSEEGASNAGRAAAPATNCMNRLRGRLICAIASLSADEVNSHRGDWEEHALSTAREAAAYPSDKEKMTGDGKKLRREPVFTVMGRHITGNWEAASRKEWLVTNGLGGGRYEGDSRQRGGAYHQGTVWSWLLGPFALAG
jgi:hypothetical protein